MPSGELSISRSKVVFSPDIALAVYRELASHLEQIEDVGVELFGKKALNLAI